jgi:hypothetical protein
MARMESVVPSTLSPRRRLIRDVRANKLTMRSEFQFFMTAEDEAEFVLFAEPLAERLERASDTQWFLRIGDCAVQFLRSRLHRGELISGRIALATSGFGLCCKAADECERLYKRLRSWLKKSYSNRMTCRNIRIKNSRMAIRTLWVSPRVLELLRHDPSITLKQIPEAFVVFEPEINAEQVSGGNCGKHL